MKYHGFIIVRANGRGGKAGKGCNRTTSIQVRESLPLGGYVIVKQFRFGEGCDSREVATAKAREHVDGLERAKRKEQP